MNGNLIFVHVSILERLTSSRSVLFGVNYNMEHATAYIPLYFAVI